MFKIDGSLIRQDAASDEVYKRGKLYYKSGRMRSLRWNHVEKCVTGEVKGVSGIYETNIWFEASGDFHRVNCTCPAFHKFEGLCKHLVTTLIAAKIHEKSIGKLVNSELEEIAEVEDDSTENFFQSIERDYKKPGEKLKLEITYLATRKNPQDDIEHFLKFRVGKDKFYVVSNIKQFVNSIAKGEIMEFGKNFVYDPKQYRLADVDLEIIYLLKKIQDVENSLLQTSHYKADFKSLFIGKQIKIPSSFLSDLFNILYKRTFNAEILNKNYERIKITKNKAPFKLDVEKADEGLILKMDREKEILVLSDEGKYVFLGDEIIQLPKAQRAFAISLMQLFKGSDTSVIQDNYKERFFSEIIPNIENICDMNISKELESDVLRTKLEAKVYLDTKGRQVLAKPVFKYDEYEIEPFESQKSKNKDLIVARDMESESRIFEKLENLNFRKVKSAYVLSQEEDIFQFVNDGVQELQSVSTVYYSDTFRSIKIKNPQNFKSKISLNQETDLLEFTFEHEVFSPDEYSEILKAMKQKRKFYRLKDGSFLPLESDGFKNTLFLMEDIGIEKMDKSIIELPKYHAIYLGQRLDDVEIKEIERNNLFNNLIDKLSNAKNIEYTTPKNLNGRLREYQKKGFRWLKTLSDYGMGGILADDMGLGKTIQAIAFLVSEKAEKPKLNTSIVIAPTSLVYNWESECKKFAPNLKVGLLVGNKANRRREMERLDDYDLIITSYGLIRRDKDLYAEKQFEYCFLDEAQHIKNPYSKGAKAVKELTIKNRFALTGTPMENSLSELWSIFDFIMPGYLSTHSVFVEKYEGPIVKYQDTEAMQKLTSQIRPFIMRRMKSEVLLELPEKIETQITTELTDEQKKVYMAFLKQARGEMSDEIKIKGIGKSHIKILALLTRLRQLCCDPSVFLDGYKGGSAKMELLEEIVTEGLSGGHRILVFSQFTGMLDGIEKRLESMDVEYFRLDGSTPMKKRGEMVEDFNSGEKSVFLISLKAGGTGLNLTGADMVIHFDPWWNPAVEDQATDRAYRMGQDQKVQVLKLIAKGTIEEKIAKLQQRKKEMVETVLKPGENILSKMSEQEIIELFDM